MADPAIYSPLFIMIIVPIRPIIKKTNAIKDTVTVLVIISNTSLLQQMLYLPRQPKLPGRTPFCNYNITGN